MGKAKRARERREPAKTKPRQKEKPAKKAAPGTAQQTIPYREMHRDGICRVTNRLYTKSIEFGDINYQLAQNEDKTTAFNYWCDFYNYFDPSISLQVSCISQKARIAEMEAAIRIDERNDEFDEIRREYDGVLKEQMAKGNNGRIRKKYITFGVEAANLKEAKPTLERIETEILGNLKAMGSAGRPLKGWERLKLLYEILNEETQEPFRFRYDMLHQSGLSTRDFIAPTSFDFRSSRYFRMGQTRC